MNRKQREFMRHALGLDAQRRSYRNRFLAAPEDFEAWDDIVKHGFARAGQMAGRNRWYSCTLDGARAVLNKGETLDLEDFPSREVQT